MINAIRQARRYGEQLSYFDEIVCRGEYDYDSENVLRLIEAAQVFRNQFRGTDLEQKIEAAYMAGLISS